MARTIAPGKRGGGFPVMGAHAAYRRRGGRRRIVRVAAAACGGRMMIETIDADGQPMRVTVRIERLGAMEFEPFDRRT